MRRLDASFIRFAVVGVVSNATLYLLYLGLTGLGLGHKVAMTIVYIIGVTATFLANRSWSFQSRRTTGGSFLRYILAYCAGYALNYVALVLLVDIAGYRHELVQAAMVVIIAVVMFVLQRYWVFAEPVALASRE